MNTKFRWWKLIAGYLFFIFFHQIYDILGGGVVATILGEGIESIYAHMKMYFYAYVLVSIIEYLMRRRQIASADSFWTTRALIAASFPWMSIAIWFIPVALGFELGNNELAYSLVMTALGLYFAFRMDEGLEGVEFRSALKALVWIAFLAAVITYVGFSFQVPDNFLSRQIRRSQLLLQRLIFRSLRRADWLRSVPEGDNLPYRFNVLYFTRCGVKSFPYFSFIIAS